MTDQDRAALVVRLRSSGVIAESLGGEAADQIERDGRSIQNIGIALSRAVGNPHTVDTARETVEEALADMAAARIAELEAALAEAQKDRD